MFQEVKVHAKNSLHKVSENPFLREFKEFAMRGSVIDLAIGIMVGGGFNKLISSLVNDIIMPPLGVLIGRVDFGDMFIDLSGTDPVSLAAAREAGSATLNYGLFFNTLLDFVIIAFVTFLLVKQINRWKRKDELPPPAGTKPCPFCAMDIPLKAVRCPLCTSSLQGQTA
ncbi:MAG: large conductance mechanosensitive channel protein MscL [Candidatus Peribacteraceae bacterium]|jgi:large conductance mechanosensitive channel